MFDPQYPASEHAPDSDSFAPKEIYPMRIVIVDRNKAGQWFQPSDCGSSDLLAGERVQVYEETAAPA